MLAALHPALELLAVTAVNGNVAGPFATHNSLRVLDFIGRSDIPVFQGSRKPILRADQPIPRDQRKATGIHVEVLPLPEAQSVKQPGGAVEFLVETFRHARE